MTTEHFTLQGARASTIAKSVGRATMFLTSVSGGLVALGPVATATHIGSAFYAFGLALLPTLTFVGLLTFERALQSGVEDYGYAVRIARLRAYYFDSAPEVTPYLASVSTRERLAIQGLRGGARQLFRSVAGIVGVITGVLAGSTIGLAADVRVLLARRRTGFRAGSRSRGVGRLDALPGFGLGPGRAGHPIRGARRAAGVSRRRPCVGCSDRCSPAKLVPTNSSGARSRRSAPSSDRPPVSPPTITSVPCGVSARRSCDNGRLPPVSRMTS